MATAKKTVAKKVPSKTTKKAMTEAKAIAEKKAAAPAEEGKTVKKVTGNLIETPKPAKKAAAKKTSKKKADAPAAQAPAPVAAPAPVVPRPDPRREVKARVSHIGEDGQRKPGKAPVAAAPAPSPADVIRQTPAAKVARPVVPSTKASRQAAPAPVAPTPRHAPAPAPVIAAAPAAVETPPPPPKSPVKFHDEPVQATKVNVRKFPLVPLYGDSSLSQNNFAKPSTITVELPDGSSEAVKSGFLGFNKSIELLLISNSQSWMERQFTTEGDHIGEDLKLLAICGVLDDQPINIQVNVNEHQFHPAVGDARYCTINTEFTYVSENRRVFLIKVEGNVNLDSGRAYLSATCNRPELVPQGFFLQASRQSFVK